MAKLLRLLNRNTIRNRSFICHPFTRNIQTTCCLNEKKQNELLTLDPIELATGMYKKDILDKLGSKDDPYSVKTYARGVGTKEQPNMIPSAFKSRMVGCICEEDSDSIVWMWLHRGEPKCCQCGYWFQLYYEKPPFSEENINVV